MTELISNIERELPNSEENRTYNDQIDAIESFLLALLSAGVVISNEHLFESIDTALDAIGNN